MCNLQGLPFILDLQLTLIFLIINLNLERNQFVIQVLKRRIIFLETLKTQVI